MHFNVHDVDVDMYRIDAILENDNAIVTFLYYYFNWIF